MFTFACKVNTILLQINVATIKITIIYKRVFANIIIVFGNILVSASRDECDALGRRDEQHVEHSVDGGRVANGTDVE